jgi:hypothetical protein
VYSGNKTLVFNLSAFKHDVTEKDVETAMSTALLDELMEGFDHKYLVVGFDMNRNLIAVMYNVVSEDMANSFSAMIYYRNEVIMPVLIDEEADALDELLTKTTPKLNPTVQGPFIRHRETMGT